MCIIKYIHMHSFRYSGAGCPLRSTPNSSVPNENTFICLTYSENSNVDGNPKNIQIDTEPHCALQKPHT